MRTTQIRIDNEWVDGEPVIGEIYRKPIGVSGWHTQIHAEKTDTPVTAEGREFGALLPDAVALELEEIRNNASEPVGKRRAVNRVLWDIQSNVKFDPASGKFINLMAGLVTHTSLTQAESDAIIAELQS